MHPFTRRGRVLDVKVAELFFFSDLVVREDVATLNIE